MHREPLAQALDLSMSAWQRRAFTSMTASNFQKCRRFDKKASLGAQPLSMRCCPGKVLPSTNVSLSNQVLEAPSKLSIFEITLGRMGGHAKYCGISVV